MYVFWVQMCTIWDEKNWYGNLIFQKDRLNQDCQVLTSVGGVLHWHLILGRNGMDGYTPGCFIA